MRKAWPSCALAHREARGHDQSRRAPARSSSPRRRTPPPARLRRPRRLATSICAPSVTATSGNCAAGIGVGEAAAQRAALADRVVADRPRRPRPAAGSAGAPASESATARWRASAPTSTNPPCSRMTCQLGDVVQVDQLRRLRQAHVHHRHQALAAGDDLGHVAMLGQQAQRVVERRGPVVAEGGWLHVVTSIIVRSSGAQALAAGLVEQMQTVPSPPTARRCRPRGGGDSLPTRRKT